LSRALWSQSGGPMAMTWRGISGGRKSTQGRRFGIAAILAGIRGPGNRKLPMEPDYIAFAGYFLALRLL
jgi:hypothetical protein